MRRSTTCSRGSGSGRCPGTSPARTGRTRFPSSVGSATGADSVASDLVPLVELGNLLRDWVVDPSERRLIDSFAGIGRRRCARVSARRRWALPRRPRSRAGLADGKGLVEQKTNDLGTARNGWTINYHGPAFGDDYLLRAAVAEDQVYVTVPEEALYPVAKTDAEGRQLTGANAYRLVFPRGAPPPVDAFWSVTMYRRDAYPLVENP